MMKYKNIKILYYIHIYINLKVGCPNLDRKKGGKHIILTCMFDKGDNN